MKKRARKSNHEDQNVDRLSDLPDALISHILSFIPTHNSVQTSILAKRWRFLWAHVPVLRMVCLQSQTMSKTKRSRFPGMLCAVMLRHKAQSLNTFRLAYIKDDDDDDDDIDGPCYELEACFATVVERNVQDIFLHINSELPGCLLTCKTLVVLTITGRVRIPSSGTIYLPSLKKFDYICYFYGVDLPRLLSGCPVLEDLTIVGYPLSSCIISSPALKNLTMFTHVIGTQDQPTEYLVRINAPALTFLLVNDCSYKRISVLPPASLVEAHITLKTCVESDDLCPRRVLKFVDSFCNVKCLSISGMNAEFPDLGVAAGPFVRFGNLTKLKLSAADSCLLTKFLQSADQLEVLILREVYKKSESWTEPMEERCACLLHSLKTVTIHDFECTEQDCNMVTFILRNAKVLKRMEIHCQQHNLQKRFDAIQSITDLKKKFDALQRISLVCRGSTECELVFV